MSLASRPAFRSHVLLVESQRAALLTVPKLLQDRVIQVYGGCVFMDFSKEYFLEHGHGQCVFAGQISACSSVHV
jgi:hypothetical protein